MNTVAADVREAYREGVAALLAGDAVEAVRRLEPLAGGEAVPFELRLALAKGYLASGRPAEARTALDALTEPPPEDTALAAYLALLSAAAEALGDSREAALARLAEVSRLDPRMEHAARELRRRIENSRPPLIRF